MNHFCSQLHYNVRCNFSNLIELFTKNTDIPMKSTRWFTWRDKYENFHKNKSELPTSDIYCFPCRVWLHKNSPEQSVGACASSADCCWNGSSDWGELSLLYWGENGTLSRGRQGWGGLFSVGKWRVIRNVFSSQNSFPYYIKYAES